MQVQLNLMIDQELIRKARELARRSGTDLDEVFNYGIKKFLKDQGVA